MALVIPDFFVQGQAICQGATVAFDGLNDSPPSLPGDGSLGGIVDSLDVNTKEDTFFGEGISRSHKKKS